MHWINWVVIVAYLTYLVTDSIRRARGLKTIEGYFLANRGLPWWAVGMTVMATQLSAITMIGTTGQGATDGMRFVQFYFGLPVAMVILGVTIVPYLHGANVYTAYEFLERRFGPRTRSLTAFLFLCSRGLSCGTIISAPAIVFSAIFGWPMWLSVAVIGVPTVLYVVIGGVQAVTWADVKQMFMVVTALVAVVITLLVKIPAGPDAALTIAGAAGRLRVFDFSFTLKEQYTFWSGMLGGTFLMLSYFGTDQSQVQRYLTARSVDEARSSHLMSAFWKIPLQGLILLVGVLVFVFYLFVAPPLYWNPEHDRAVAAAQPAAYADLSHRADVAWQARRERAAALGAAPRDHDAAERAAFRAADSAYDAVRTEALTVAGKVTGEATRDVNYIIPRFVLAQLPVGLGGLFIAAVIAAAMSAVAGELSALSTATVIDFYKRWITPQAPEAHYLTVSRRATAMWGAVACIVAVYAGSIGSLIEVVNRFGSFFYGSILGVFFLAMIPRARAAGAFIGLVAGMVCVGAVSFFAPGVAFLWYNVIGVVVVVAVGMAISAVAGSPAPADS
ncbi:MAG TPA: sodium:solute symporter [Gemmatimonadaceae bacterium]|nr:sodium:solute symporter [Gemmatimonadaceae bacterium]